MTCCSKWLLNERRKATNGRMEKMDLAPDDLSDDRYHARLKSLPKLWSIVGIIHTLLGAGIVFGWASLLPILRQEGIDLSPVLAAQIFTHGAIGNYLCTLPFGVLLDRVGPKTCGITASVLFGLGLFFCSLANVNTTYLNVGFTLVGFAGPALQLPTLHLARLFPGTPREGGNGGAAIFMSAQAAAFDGGTMIFALFSFFSKVCGISSVYFFRIYLAVPLFTLLTAILVWPNEILPDPNILTQSDGYIGAGSPYLSPSGKFGSRQRGSALRDAPLSVILTKPPFYCLAAWVAVHILKLNFVVATINDQLEYIMKDDPEIQTLLINVFGAMLPFGFVVLPIVAYLLAKSTLTCFQLANTVGVLYGAVLAFFPSQAWYQVFIVFTSVATSRQVVYSAVFHQTGELFGFKNYGVLLGLINIVVSSFSLIQGPMVEWSEGQHSYFGANFLLLVATMPLFVIVYLTIPKEHSGAKPKALTEETALLGMEKPRRLRSVSDAQVS